MVACVAQYRVSGIVYISYWYCVDDVVRRRVSFVRSSVTVTYNTFLFSMKCLVCSTFLQYAVLGTETLGCLGAGCTVGVSR